MAKQKLIKKWSYSRYCCYKDCPSMYEWRYILKKDKFIKSRAMERGTMIHTKAENYVNGKIKGMPPELVNFDKEFIALKREFSKGHGYCEPDISTNLDGSSTTMKKSNYFVGFADFFHAPKHDTFTVIDYKTGKKYPSHQSQGHAYSTFLLQQNPSQESIDVEFWYLDDKNEQTNVKDFHFEQSDLPDMLALWDRRITKMYGDKKFIKTPYQWCGSCSRNKKNGGDCSG